MKNIVYIGRFVFPDKNASAHRVINNSKIFIELDYNVIFISIGNVKKTVKKTFLINGKNYDLWIVPFLKGNIGKLLEFSRYNLYLNILNEYENIKMVTLYNFPSIPFYKILKYSKSRGIKVISDVADWYEMKNISPISLVSGIDTFFRMRILNKKADGLIVVSKYLYNYYNEKNKILLPPLVDLSEKKWRIINSKSNNKTDFRKTFVFAGNPNGSKENLKDLIGAFNWEKIAQYADLKIIGISKDKLYKKIVKSRNDRDLFKNVSENISFMGNIDHELVIGEVKKADFTVIIRKNSRLNKAGFPTKFVESITCGTPCVCTSFSDLEDYVGNGVNGIIINEENIKSSLLSIILERFDILVKRDLFDYHNYTSIVQKFFKEIL